jgi:hypothetical protein
MLSGVIWLKGDNISRNERLMRYVQVSFWVNILGDHFFPLPFLVLDWNRDHYY